jgi:hypothetical protein
MAGHWSVVQTAQNIKITPLSCHITPKSFLNVHPNLFSREAANISGLIAFDYVEIRHLVLK